MIMWEIATFMVRACLVALLVPGVYLAAVMVRESLTELRDTSNSGV